MMEGYVEHGIRDHSAVQRLHMTITGNQVPTLGVANERRVAYSQTCTNFERAASDLRLEQTRVSILSWNPGPRRGSHRDFVTRQFHVTDLTWCRVHFLSQTHFPLGHEVKAVRVPLMESFPDKAKIRFSVNVFWQGNDILVFCGLTFLVVRRNRTLEKRLPMPQTSSSHFVPLCCKKKLTRLLLISTVQVGGASQDHNSSSRVRLRRRSRKVKLPVPPGHSPLRWAWRGSTRPV